MNRTIRYRYHAGKTAQHGRRRAILAALSGALAVCAITPAMVASAQDGTWDAGWAPRNSDQKGIPGLFEDTWNLGGGGSYAGDMTTTATVVQSDGKILVTGFGWNTSNAQDQNACIVRRYDADGSVDTSFGTGGAVVTNWRSTDANPKLDCYSKSIALQADGKIVYAGQLQYPSAQTPTIMVARLNKDGTTDQSFGDDGFLTDFGFDANQVLIAGNNDILVAGTNIPQNFSDTDFYLATLGSNGQLKNEEWLNFGVAGGDGNEFGNAAVLESWSSGSIGNFHSHDEVYIVGVIDNPAFASGQAHHSCGIVAFNRTDGGAFSIDTGFNGSGLLNVDFPVGSGDTDTICRTAVAAPSAVVGFFGPAGVIVGGERYYTPPNASIGSASYYALEEISASAAVTRHDSVAFFSDLNEPGAFNSINGMAWNNIGKLVTVGYAGIGANGDQNHAPSDGVIRRFNNDYSVDGSFAADHSGTLSASLDTTGVAGISPAQREWLVAVATDPLHGRLITVGERSILIGLVPNLYAWFLGAVHDGTVQVSDRIFANGFD